MYLLEKWSLSNSCSQVKINFSLKLYIHLKFEEPIESKIIYKAENNGNMYI